MTYLTCRSVCAAARILAAVGPLILFGATDRAAAAAFSSDHRMRMSQVQAPLPPARRSDTILLATGQPMHPGVGTLVEELTLGNGSDAPEYRFTDVRLALGRDGSLIVIDDIHMRPSTVRQYDRSGTFVRAIGRGGRGPGEFFSPPGDVRQLADGRILLSDQAGLLFYSSTAAPLGRRDARSGSNVGSPFFIDPTGFIFVSGAAPLDKAPRGSRPRTSTFGNLVSVLVRLRLDGTIVDTLLSPIAELPSRVRVGRQLLPFAPHHAVAWSPLGYFVTSNTATYAIDLRIPPRGPGSAGYWRSGDPVHSIRRSIPSVPVQDAERSDWRQGTEMFNRSGGRSYLSWSWTGPDVPRVKPPVRDLFVSDDGRIWVRLSQPARLDPSVKIRTAPATSDEEYDNDARKRWIEPSLYDVFEPGGRYVGQVRFPDGLNGVVVQGDIVWGVVTDTNDVPSVKRYRIRWGA